MNTNIILKKHQILPGNNKKFDLGCISLTANREKEGWHLATSDNCNGNKKLTAEENSTVEYFHTGKSNSIIIAPALPPKPLVFKGSRLNVLPGQKLTFFIKIPLIYQVYFSKILPENLLKEITLKRLSDTWFGEPENGEPAFSIGSEYFLDMEQIEISEFEAICPVSVQNNSSVNLDVQRLILRDENMTLYKNNDKIVTSIVQIEYKGSDVISSVEYHFSKQYNGEKQEILAKPRNTSGKNLLKINFHFIKNMYKSE